MSREMIGVSENLGSEVATSCCGSICGSTRAKFDKFKRRLKVRDNNEESMARVVNKEYHAI